MSKLMVLRRNLCVRGSQDNTPPTQVLWARQIVRQTICKCYLPVGQLAKKPKFCKKRNTCAMLAKSAQICFCRKISYKMLPWSVWTNIIQKKNHLCNVDPQSTNNFAQKNQLQFCLDISGPTLHKEITCAMLVHG